MLLKLNEKTNVRSLRNHSHETVIQLRQMLAEGVTARPDPRRKNFYEVEAGCQIYYIYVSPATGKVTLLAQWDSERKIRPPEDGHLALAACCTPGR